MKRRLVRVVSSCCLAALVSPSHAAETAGVGIALERKGDQLVIHAIVPNSPASVNRALHVGDRILEIAEGGAAPVRSHGLTIEEAVGMIRGPKGTVVRLTLVPPGKKADEAYAVSLTRGELKVLAGLGDGVPLALGSRAPDFPLHHLTDRKQSRLRDYAGKVVVLEFWSTWCGPCQDAVASLQAYLDRYPQWRGKVVLIAASIDEDAETARKHVLQKSWSKTLNVWLEAKAVKAYHVDAVPAVCVVDAKGFVAWSGSAGGLARTVNRLITAGSQ